MVGNPFQKRLSRIPIMSIRPHGDGSSQGKKPPRAIGEIPIVEGNTPFVAELLELDKEREQTAVPPSQTTRLKYKTDCWYGSEFGINRLKGQRQVAR